MRGSVFLTGQITSLDKVESSFSKEEGEISSRDLAMSAIPSFEQEYVLKT